MCAALQLPDEVFRLIVAELPVEHRFQLRAVCKRWNAILHDVHFLKQYFHLTRRAPLCFWSTGDGFAAYNPETDLWRKFPTSFILKEDFWRDDGDELAPAGNPEVRGEYHKVFGGGDGLLLVETLVDEERMLYVTNPMTRSHRKLTEVPFSWDVKILGMTFDKSSNSYKVFGAKYGHKVRDRGHPGQRNEGSSVRFGQKSDGVSIHVRVGDERINVHFVRGSDDDGTIVRVGQGEDDHDINLQNVDRGQGPDPMNVRNVRRGRTNTVGVIHRVQENDHHHVEAYRLGPDKRRQSTLYMYDSEVDSWRSIGRWKSTSPCDVKAFDRPTPHRGVLHFLLTEEEPRGKKIRVLRFDRGKSWHELTAPISQELLLAHLFEWRGNLMLACVVERDEDENFESFPAPQILQLDEERNIWVEVTTMSDDLGNRYTPFEDRLAITRSCHIGEGFVFFTAYRRNDRVGYKFVRHFICDLAMLSWWELPEPHSSYRKDPPDFNPFFLKSSFDTVY